MSCWTSKVLKCSSVIYFILSLGDLRVPVRKCAGFPRIRTIIECHTRISLTKYSRMIHKRKDILFLPNILPGKIYFLTNWFIWNQQCPGHWCFLKCIFRTNWDRWVQNFVILHKLRFILCCTLHIFHDRQVNIITKHCEIETS